MSSSRSENSLQQQAALHHDPPSSIEIESNNVKYLVSPEKYKRGCLELLFSLINWLGLSIALLLMGILDSIFSKNERVELHWIAFLMTLSLTFLLQCVLLCCYRKYLSWSSILTVLNVSWFIVAITAFYWIGIKGIFLITTVACTFTKT